MCAALSLTVGYRIGPFGRLLSALLGLEKHGGVSPVVRPSQTTATIGKKKENEAMPKKTGDALCLLETSGHTRVCTRSPTRVQHGAALNSRQSERVG